MRCLWGTAWKSVLLMAMAAAVIQGRVWLWPPLHADDDRPTTSGQVTSFDPELPRPAPPPSGFITSMACAECHADIYATYSQTGMYQSLAPLSTAPVIEDYTTRNSFDAPTSTHFRGRTSYFATRTDDVIRHREVWQDDDGREVYDQGVQVDYCMGSGHRGRSYLMRRGDMLFMSPMTWYSTGRKWDYSPGYEIRDWRFERRVLDGCLACHAGQVAADRERPDRYHQPPFIEHGIGCERCHGPGESHARHHHASSEGADPLLNLTSLSPRQRDQICNQCHLLGVERVLRYGRSEFDFRPGDDLSDIWVTFLHSQDDKDRRPTPAVSHAEQMLDSRCFAGSNGRLECISCHDPHATPAPEARLEFFRQRCLQCHAVDTAGCALPEPERLSQVAGDSCIACHMPKFAAGDVPHTSQTDHRIVRRPRPETKRPESPVIVTDLQVLEADRIPQLEQDRARGLLIMQHAEQERDVFAVFEAWRLLEPVSRALPDDAATWEALGIIHRQLNQRELARRAWQRALALEPERETSLKHLAVLYHDNGELPEALAMLDRLLAINPWHVDYFGRRAHILGQMGRLTQGIAAAERGLALDQSSHQLHGWLAAVHSRLGNQAAAEKHRRLYQQIAPQKTRR
jgi:predicted CXXCH cytochrome family protein